MKRMLFMALCTGIAWNLVTYRVGAGQDAASPPDVSPVENPAAELRALEAAMALEGTYEEAIQAYSIGRSVAADIARNIASSNKRGADRAQALAELAYAKAQRKWSQAVRALKDAKSEGERDQRIAEVGRLLGEEFDRRIAAEEKSLDQLEQRVARLREQVQRRRDAKSKLVALRLETLLNEINGLGWPGGQSAGAWEANWSAFPLAPSSASAGFDVNVEMAPAPEAPENAR